MMTESIATHRPHRGCVDDRTASRAQPGRTQPGGRRYSLLIDFLALIIAVAFLCSCNRSAGQTPGTEAPAPLDPTGAAETATPSPPLPTANQQPTVSQSTTTSPAAADSPASIDAHPTPTPEPGGQVVALRPRAGDAGWWSSGEASGNYLGDSFLYAGYYQSQAFVSAVRFELALVPRGAPIAGAQLRLTGLNAERFDPAADGTWTIQILAPNALPDYAHADFQTIFNAPAAATLFPTLHPSDLGEGQVNVLTLDAATLSWLEKAVIDGVPAVIIRITGPSAGDSVFAWDSGAGPATAGQGPQLLLSLGATPPTPPSLPTEAVIVATLTPTPANVLTAAADALTATYIATTVGTATPLPYRAVTPTPPPGNLATAQAMGAAESFVPVVIYTPKPANGATATANARYATAVAVTTGTFTPVPVNAVTPVIIPPTLFPESVVTAAAQMLTSTAQAQRVGTITPLPTGALIATVTATRPMVYPTETPANYATSAARVAYATAVAITTGTFTPIPRNAITPTSPPRATPLPLMVPVTPLPTPTFTPVPPGSMPGALVGKVLFYSDRDGSTRLYAFDPGSGRLFWVTQDWPQALAWARDSRSPDGRNTVVVQTVTDQGDWNTATGRYVGDRTATQLFIRDNQTNRSTRLTNSMEGDYDPAWSPTGDRIAFVSAAAGNDEIYTIKPDGSDLKRLTSNSWEWDKHPSWSPDGKQIVFWSNRGSGRRQLWIMDADGGNQRPLTKSVYNDWDPIWVK